MKERKQSFTIETNIQLIKYKGIQQERFEDAPFVGALIIANECYRECYNCFNQHLKSISTIEETAKEIINKVQENPFNEGIILSGLEWGCQPREAFELITEALLRGLKVILYTSVSEDMFKVAYPYIYDLPIYIKFGRYIDGYKSHKDKTGVRLASPNQYISCPEDRM